MNVINPLKIITDKNLLTVRERSDDTIKNQSNDSDLTITSIDTPTVYSPASIVEDIEVIIESDTPPSVCWKDNKLTILTAYLNTYS